jgi:DNA helicase HerA-like ATPase
MSLQITTTQGQTLALDDSALSQGLLVTLERRYLYGVPYLGLRPVEPDPNLMANTRFLQVVEIAHSADLIRSMHPLNMQNVLSSFRDGSHSIIYVVSGKAGRTNLYTGLYKNNSSSSAHTADHIEILNSALHGNYPGIRLANMGPKEISTEILAPIASMRHVGAITGIPSLKEEARDFFVQGLERLTNSLRGEEYSLVVVAEPLSEIVMDEVIQRCRDLGSEIHAYVRSNLTGSNSQSSSHADQRGGSVTGGLLIGAGSLLGTMLGFGPLMGMAAPALQGLLGAAGFSMGRTETTTDTRSNSASREVLNKTAEFCEEALDRYVTRMQEGKNLGFWNVGVFLLASNANTMLRGQGVVRAILSGEKTYFEPMRAIDLTHQDEVLRDALMQFRNPIVELPPQAPHPMGPVFQRLATPMNTAELSLVINLPREEVPGIRMVPIADFGLNPPSSEGFALGNVTYRGEVLADKFFIPTKSLTKHTFITGITGSGKTNTCLALLRAAYQYEKAPFMVIEPAKQEYRLLAADPDMGKDLQIFTLGDETTSPFRLNPFQFARGYPVLTHIDLLKAVFNASFPMYASMPYILEEAILDVYTDRGWDLASSKNRYIDASVDDYAPYLPSLEDLYRQIDVVVERKHYAQQLSMDISAALKARIKSLLIGGKGLMLNCPRSYPLEKLFNNPTVMELKHVGDDAEKAFLMALLLINLYEYCETAREYGGSLQHITLIEESHRLLKNIPASVSAEGANPRGKAVEMFSDILAEIREYGEGFIIVDQVPAKLTPDALKNTNLKILHRIVADDDRQSVGSAMNLTPEQREQVVRLRVGQAIVHNEYLDKPILLQVNSVKDNMRQKFNDEIGAEGVHQRMLAFQKEVVDIYRRFPGCDTCDAPCTYLSEDNAPNSEGYEAFQGFIDSVLIGSPPAARAEWTHTSSLLKRGLQKQFHGAPLSLGVSFCNVVQLAHMALRERNTYYRGGIGGYRSYIKLEKLLVGSINALSQASLSREGTNAIVEFMAEMRTQVAVEPRRSEPGCRLCRRPCWYGFTVQRDLQSKSRLLSERLKNAAAEPDFSGNYPRLVQVVKGFTQDITPFAVSAQQLHHLAYCYLVNSGASRSHILKGFQNEQNQS